MTLNLLKHHFQKHKRSLSSLSAFTSFGLYGFRRLRVHFFIQAETFFPPLWGTTFPLKLFHLLSINRTYNLWQKFWLEGMSGGHHIQPAEAALPFYQVRYGFVGLSLANLQGRASTTSLSTLYHPPLKMKVFSNINSCYNLWMFPLAISWQYQNFGLFHLCKYPKNSCKTIIKSSLSLFFIRLDKIKQFNSLKCHFLP